MRTIFSLSLQGAKRRCSSLLFSVACLAVAVMGFTFVACGDDGSSTNFEERRDPAASCDAYDDCECVGDDCECVSGDCDCGDGGDCECAYDDCDPSSSSKKAASSSSATAEERTSSSEKAPPSSSSKKDEKPSSSSSADQSSSGITALSSSARACSEEDRIMTLRDKETGYPIYYICKDGYYELIIESSSSRSLSSSSYFDMSKQYNRNYSYGEFTDPRDGQVYKTVKHYDGAWTDTITVFAANLNYGKMVTTSTIKHDDDIVEKICFNDDPWYCENGFGGLYSWSEAMGFPNACDTVLVGTTAECNVKIDAPTNSTLQRPYALALHQGICPEGWHIMNEHEWRTISYEFSTFGIISEIFSSEDRTFTGFSLLLGGIAENNDDGGVNFHDLGEYAYFTLPEEKGDDANRIFFASKLNVDFSGRSRLKRTYVSVRCVKDYEPDLIYKDE